MKKQKTYKVGDTLKLTKDLFGFDEFNLKEATTNGELVYTVKIEKAEKVKLTLE